MFSIAWHFRSSISFVILFASRDCWVWVEIAFWLLGRLGCSFVERNPGEREGVLQIRLTPEEGLALAALVRTDDPLNRGSFIEFVSHFYQCAGFVRIQTASDQSWGVFLLLSCKPRKKLRESNEEDLALLWQDISSLSMWGERERGGEGGTTARPPFA